MANKGRETLTMETDENISFRREKGCFLTTFNIFLLLGAFVIAVVATGLLVYYLSDKPQWDSKEKFKYDVISQQPQHSRGQPEFRSVAPETETASIDVIKPGMSDEKMKQDLTEKVMDVRLPRSIMPLHYHVKLIPFINGNFSIHGNSAMTFKVLQETSNVTLHINGIVTKNETIKVTKLNDMDGKGILITKHLYDIDRQFYTAVLNEELEKGTNYVIQMDYIGFLNDNMNGFYRSNYLDENGKKVWLAATQFQPTDARKAFPCLDEPALKANFTIEIAREKNMTSIANMPLQESVPMEGNPDWMWDKFETSVPMSTYLVAFAVSDFVHRKSIDDNVYEFRVWARKSAISQAEYALKIGPQVSKFFEDYFQVPFPLPKQDMIALPDFSAGAMENWGLITYRETAMLYDPKISTARDKFSVGSVIVHELAHQWFGNLVTPSWWTDLWLNEGFASYMEYVGLNAVEPTYRVHELFAVVDLHVVFGLDCLASSHPINIEVQHPDQINEIFDKISYSKGASIIRMMNHFLTEDTFRKGLSKYLHGLAYSSAEQDDLWRYLTNQAMADGTLPRNMKVKTIMDTWTLQMGFPVITVTKKNEETALIKQERFLLVKSENSTDSHDYKWWVPITFATQSNPDFSVTKPKEWMNPSEATKIIKGVPSKEWVIFNVQQAGYYRVNYDDKNWEAIIDQLQRDHNVIPAINRAQIIDDSLALARAGLLPYETSMRILSYLKNENEYVPWQAALTGLEFIDNMFAQTGGYGALKEFLLSLTVPMYEKLGFADRISDPYLEQRLRSSLLYKVCNLGYQPCVQEAVALYQKWMQTPDDYTVISPNLKSIVYCTAIKAGGYEEWKFAWGRYQNANVASEKRQILNAMGCTKESWIQGGYLERSLRGEGEGVRKQDIRDVIGAVARTEHGKLVAWEFFKNRFNKIIKLFGESSFTLDGIVKVVTTSLNTRNHLLELDDFQGKHKGRFGSAERAMIQAVENSRNNINWMDNHYSTILMWLTDNGYVNSI